MFAGSCDPLPPLLRSPGILALFPIKSGMMRPWAPMDPATQDPRALSQPSHLNLRPSGGWAPDPTAMAQLVWEASVSGFYFCPPQRSDMKDTNQIAFLTPALRTGMRG